MTLATSILPDAESQTLELTKKKKVREKHLDDEGSEIASHARLTTNKAGRAF
jgi:hypothetical protein